MDKREIRASLLLGAIALLALWSNLLFRESEVWTWTVLGIAGIAFVLILKVLVRSLRRQRAEYWKEHRPPA
jgi:hypothetical protein